MMKYYSILNCKSLYSHFWCNKAFLIFLFLFSWISNAQVTIHLTKIPVDTPKDETIFITGTFNNWNPADSAYVMQMTDSVYAITLPEGLNKFEYKFTRGSWKTTEGDKNGKDLLNRVFVNNSEAAASIEVSVKSWLDIVLADKPQITFIVNKIPENTPHDARIYVTGEFNEWQPGNSFYSLEKQPNGSYSYTLRTNLDTLEYKFTRGNWKSVEGRKNGRERPNRKLILGESKDQSINIEILSWEDMDGGKTSVYMFFLLLSAFQGFLLVIAINTIQNNNLKANKVLSVLIMLISLALLARVGTSYRYIFQWQPKLILMPELIFFLYSPVFLIYIQNLLTIQVSEKSKIWFHFIPFGIHLLAYIPLFIVNEQDFLYKIVDRDLETVFASVGGLALIYNIYYWTKFRKLLIRYVKTSSQAYSFEQNLQYLKGVLVLKATCLAIWSFTFIYSGVGLLFDFDNQLVKEISTDTIWGVFSILTYFLGYVAMNQPEIFKFHEDKLELEEDEPIPVEEKKEFVVDEKVKSYMKELQEIMENEKPYYNSKLTLGELSKMMNLHSLELSKIINEGFQMNFYDLVNSYRVKAFIEQVGLDKNQNETFLSIAFMVGFNSKTAFNRAFKKQTGYSPRQYLKMKVVLNDNVDEN